ncbi:SHOCT domain-containing protein [Virgibacillus proomii]|nr:SHOCT domain-containing protein [Virgibacillus proomii]
MKKKLVLYSMQISMLKKLLTHKLISEEEYKTVKRKLMKDYHIISDITG